MSEISGFNLETGAWNDSLTGDYVWSRNNFGEAQHLRKIMILTILCIPGELGSFTGGI